VKPNFYSFHARFANEDIVIAACNLSTNPENEINNAYRRAELKEVLAGLSDERSLQEMD